MFTEANLLGYEIEKKNNESFMETEFGEESDEEKEEQSETERSR
jgi:hypothetical protein